MNCREWIKPELCSFRNLDSLRNNNNSTSQAFAKYGEKSLGHASSAFSCPNQENVALERKDRDIRATVNAQIGAFNTNGATKAPRAFAAAHHHE